MFTDIFIALSVVVTLWAMILIAGARAYQYRRKFRGHRQICDLCETNADRLIEVWVSAPHFQDRGGSLELPRRPLNGKYTPNVKLKQCTQSVCSDCFEMLNVMLNENKEMS